MISLYILGILSVGVTAFVDAISPGIAHGNPSYYVHTTGSSTPYVLYATTTPTWQTAGNATDTRMLFGNNGTIQALNTATLLLYRKASGPGTKTQINFEYSDNCTSISPDWYTLATSSIGIFASTGYSSGNNAFTWGFSASTTVGGSGVVRDFDTLAITVPTPLSCVRAVLSVPASAASSSIWGEWVAQRENN